jgi:hypothetical protein
VGRAKTAEGFNPEKYGMVFCPGCGGSGKSFSGGEKVDICKLCGGFGLIKKEGDHGYQKKRVPSMLQK